MSTLSKLIPKEKPAEESSQTFSERYFSYSPPFGLPTLISSDVLFRLSIQRGLTQV
jgi:hypothetical protein